MKPTTVGIRWRSIRAFFNWLHEEGWLKEQPTARIKVPKAPQSFPNVLGHAELGSLIRTAKEQSKSWYGYRNYAIVLTFLDTGMRRAELQALTRDHVDFKRQALLVMGKGSRERQVYFGCRLARVLREWLRLRTVRLFGNALFCTRQGYPINLGEIPRIVARLAKAAGLGQKVGCHTLRHTFATNFIRNGGDPFSLQRLLGHSDIQTTMIYVHMAGTALREAHAKASPVDRLLEG
jgi:integrase/recombinase XerD